MIKNYLYLSIMFFYVNILGYIFHFLVSRKLGPVGYGEFMVLYSFMLSISFLSNVYPSLVVKNILENVYNKYEILRFFRLISILTGSVIFLCIATTTPLIKDFLHIRDDFSLFIIAFISLILFLENVEKGFLQALGKFNVYSFLTAGELTLRLIFATVLLNLGFGINGAISSTFFSMLILLILLFFINKNLFGNVKKIPLKNITKSIILITPSGLFVYADDIFIKRVFDPVLAGYFASASILGKAYIWFILTLFSVVFVKITENKEKFIKHISTFIPIVFITFLLLECLLYLVGRNIFVLLFGDKFTNAYEILPFYIIAIFPLLINLIIYSVNVALEKIFITIYTHLAIYYLGFILLEFSNVKEYLLYIFALNLFFLLINLFLFLNLFPNFHKQKRLQ